MEITRTHTSKLETLIRDDLYQSTYPTAVQGKIHQFNLRMPYFDLLLAESTCRKGGETFLCDESCTRGDALGEESCKDEIISPKIEARYGNRHTLWLDGGCWLRELGGQALFDYHLVIFGKRKAFGRVREGFWKDLEGFPTLSVRQASCHQNLLASNMATMTCHVHSAMYKPI